MNSRSVSCAMLKMSVSRLKIGFVAGTLGQGGAERQLLLMARALKALGTDVRVYCPYRDEYYAPKLLAENIPVIWFGKVPFNAMRFLNLTQHLIRFRPHVIQAAHFHMNLPVNVLGRATRSVALAASRSDIAREISACKPLGIWGVRTAVKLIANSNASKASAIRLGIADDKVTVLSNVIDLEEFDRTCSANTREFPESNSVWSAAVGTLTQNKRFDLFLRAVARAKQDEPQLKAWIAGDGPERCTLQELSVSLGLSQKILRFLGRRNDVPSLLRQANVFIIASHCEGCPNVLLEAMAARLPIITTPAGDAAQIVEAAQAGFVVPHGDVEAMAGRLAQLSRSTDLRARLGANGRRFVETHHSADQIGMRLLQIYRAAAGRGNFLADTLTACLATN